MIKSIDINYNDKFTHKFSYIKDKHLLPNHIDFTDGLNVIIGKNGCGKSTLINILKDFTFCQSGSSKLSNDIRFWDEIEIVFDTIPLFTFNNKHKKYTPLTSINVKNDYSIPTLMLSDFKYMNTDDILDNFHNFSGYFNSTARSSGESMIDSINSTVCRLYEETDKYNLFNKFESEKHINDVYQEGLNHIKDWVNKNTYNSETKKITILMDEPDKSLDVLNLIKLKNWLKAVKDKVQIIVVLHNPLLIKEMNKNGENIIELSKFYMNAINNF